VITIHDITNVNRNLSFQLLRECADRRCTHYADGALSHFDASDNAPSV